MGFGVVGSLHSLQRMHTRLQSPSESEKTQRVKNRTEEERKCRREWIEEYIQAGKG